MPISKLDFFLAYPSLTEIKPQIKGKQRHLSTELYFLKELIIHENNQQDKKKLYKIAKYIKGTRGSKKLYLLTLSLIYNLFHGRWGTSLSFYNRIKQEHKQPCFSSIKATSVASPLKKIKAKAASANYDWEEYLKLVKASKPKAFSKFFQLALDCDKDELVPFLKNMTFQDLENECLDLNNPDNLQIDIESQKIFVSKKLLSKFVPHFQAGNGSSLHVDGSYDRFKDCLNFMIFEEDLDIAGDNIANYLKLSCEYEMDAVKDNCEKWLLQNRKSFELEELCTFASDYNLSKEFKLQLNDLVNKKVQEALTKYPWDLNLKQKLSNLAPFVTAIDLTFTSCVNKDVSVLNIFSSLKSLKLRHTKLSDAQLAILVGIKSLRKLNLESTKITDAGLAHLSHFQSLEKLNLKWTMITNAGLDHLSHLESLRTLNLAWTKINDTAYVKLAKIKNLQDLNLSDTQITNAGINQLSLLPSLRCLKLAYSIYLTEEGVANLANLPSLQSLYLARMKMKEAGLSQLANSKSLKSLHLSGPDILDADLTYFASLKDLHLSLGIADADLAKLSNLQLLKSLNLSRSDITDAGLTHLTNLQELQFLNVKYTEVTKAGLTQLAHLKNLKIIS